MPPRSKIYRIILCLVVWAAARALTVDQFYLQAGNHVDYEDLETFLRWAQNLVQAHHAPLENTWQYPPGAIYVFMVPFALPWPPFPTYIATFLTADLLVTLALLSLAWRTNKFTGAWIWVLVLPVMGKLSLLRFDTIPTAFAVLALVLPEHRWKSQIFGFVMGMGAAVKAWPAVIFLAVTDRKKALVVIAVSALTFLLIVAVTLVWCSGAMNFLRNQSGRGLEIEAVAATPWYILQAVSAVPVKWALANGSLEVIGHWPGIVAMLLHVLMLVLAMLCALWWILWTRPALREESRARSAIGCDAVFTAILLYVIISPVFSPQYLIWLVGLGAVSISSPHCAVVRPVWLVVLAALLTQALLAVWGQLVTDGPTGALFLAERNIVLVFAGADAYIAMLKALHLPRLSARRLA